MSGGESAPAATGTEYDELLALREIARVASSYLITPDEERARRLVNLIAVWERERPGGRQ